jgi:hypothetical protein
MDTASVGTLSSAGHIGVEDRYDPKSRWPFESIAKHATQAPARSLSVLSVAKTWRVVSTAVPTAGGEGLITLHCGQPVSTASLLVSVLPLRRHLGSEPPAEERLEHSLHLHLDNHSKGSAKAIRYGPVCRAGAHIVSVTLNGAHCIGSPLQILVAPGPPEPSACEIVPLSKRAKGGSGGGGVSTCSGEATTETVLALQLRDVYGNRCSTEQAALLAADGRRAALAIDVSRGTEIEGMNEGVPAALKPPKGSDAERDAASTRLFVPGKDGTLPPGSPSPSATATTSARRGAAPTAAERAGRSGRGQCEPASVVGRGVLLVGVRIARAGMHLVSGTLNGVPLCASVLVDVRPGPPRASASTAHDYLPSDSTSLSRCVSAVPRQLRLVARDACGNATSAHANRWSVTMRPPVATAASGWQPPTPTPPSHGFSCDLEPSAEGGVNTCVATYTCSVPGVHPLSVTLGGAPIGGSPMQLATLPAVWGPGLAGGVAGERATLFVRLRAEGAAPPGSAEGRKLMHTLSVEAIELGSRELASVSSRQIVLMGDGDGAEGGSEGGGPYVAGGGEVAEVCVIGATSSASWQLSVRLNGAHVQGSPFAWRVRAGAPSAERSLMHAVWVGEGKASAGTRHVGVLELRDRVGNECDKATGEVAVWLREEFVDSPPSHPLAAKAGGLPGGASLPQETSVGPASPTPAEFVDERRLTQQEVEHVGGGRYEVAWQATRSGKHSLIAVANGEALRCSQTLSVHADGAVSHATVLRGPASSKLLPQTWNVLQLRCRDATGNASELLEPSRLSVTCEGLAAPTHLKVRERPGLDGAYELLLFGEPVGFVNLHVTLDGRHVRHSPMSMEIAASSATAGRCYAFGPGLGSKGAISVGAVSRFTIVACDVTGTRRRVGGDEFKVAIHPIQSAHHLALRVKVHDGTNGAYTVSWTPPFSVGYQISITLRGLAIFGSPFQVRAKGGGQYAASVDRHPTAAETEEAIASNPAPSLDGLTSVPASPSSRASPTVRAPGFTTVPVGPSESARAAHGPHGALLGAQAPTPSQTHMRAHSALAEASVRCIDAAKDAQGRADSVQKAVDAARREGLSEMLGRFRRSMADDDGGGGAAAGESSEEDGQQGEDDADTPTGDAREGSTAAEGVPQTPVGAPPRTGPAFSPD